MKNLIETFALIILGLKTAIASNRYMPKARIAFIDVVWMRLHNMNNRFMRLYQRWKNGTLAKPRPPAPARVREARPAPRISLPRGRLWLIKDTQATAAYAGQLRHFLATHPDIPAFLEAAPQAGRILRPLCHALGINPEAPHGVKIPHLAAIAPPPRRPRHPAPPQPASQPAPSGQSRRRASMSRRARNPVLNASPRG